MFTMEINGNEYQMSFGMGFVKEVNDWTKTTVNGMELKVGLSIAISRLLDGDITVVPDIIRTAVSCAGDSIKMSEINAWLEDPKTDIDEVYQTLLDFFGESNCTKKQMQTALKNREENSGN